MLAPLRSKETNISLRPSGAQAGEICAPGRLSVMLTARPPSVGCRKISAPSIVAATYARNCPSGEMAGSISRPCALVSRLVLVSVSSGPLPPPRVSTMPAPPSTMTNAASRIARFRPAVGAGATPVTGWV